MLSLIKTLIMSYLIKVDLNNGKTAYLEYRNFDSKLNRFDNQRKILTKLDGTNSVGITAMKKWFSLLFNRF